MTPQSSRPQTSSHVTENEEEEEEMLFWGGHSPRSAPIDADMELEDLEDAVSSSSEDEAMTEDDEDEVDEIALFGHR